MSLRTEIVERLSRMDDEGFARLCAALSDLAQSGIVLKGHALGQDPSYRTLLRETDCARAMLRAFGWTIHAEAGQGFVRLVDPERRCTVQFTKDESVILALLRLLLHERAGQASYDKDVTVSVGDIRETYLQYAGAGARGFPMVSLSNVLRRLNRLRLIRTERPFESSDSARITILPTLYAVIPPERVNRAAELLTKYMEDRRNEQDGSQAQEETGGGEST